MTRRQYLLLSILFLGSLLLNAATLALLLLRPSRQALAAAALSGRIHASGSTVLLGDSILASLPEAPDGIAKFAVSGATIGYIREAVWPDARLLKPANVIIGIGINDLRNGEPYEHAFRALSALADEIAASEWEPDVVVLAVLPVTRRTSLSGRADNGDVRRLNDRLAKRAESSVWEFLDHTGLFSADGALRDSLSADGLHLNASGVNRLARLLYWGIARNDSP